MLFELWRATQTQQEGLKLEIITTLPCSISKTLLLFFFFFNLLFIFTTPACNSTSSKGQLPPQMLCMLAASCTVHLLVSNKGNERGLLYREQKFQHQLSGNIQN